MHRHAPVIMIYVTRNIRTSAPIPLEQLHGRSSLPPAEKYARPIDAASESNRCTAHSELPKLDPIAVPPDGPWGFDQKATTPSLVSPLNLPTPSRSFDVKSTYFWSTHSTLTSMSGVMNQAAATVRRFVPTTFAIPCAHRRRVVATTDAEPVASEAVDDVGGRLAELAILRSAVALP